MISKQQVLARVLLGPTHPLVLAHQQFISTWQVVATEMQARSAITPGHSGTHLPAMVVRYFQIKLAVWMKRQWDSDVVIPIPYFNDLFDKEAERDYVGWEKRLPSKYLPSAPSYTPQYHPPTPAANTPPHGSPPAHALPPPYMPPCTSCSISTSTVPGESHQPQPDKPHFSTL